MNTSVLNPITTTPFQFDSIDVRTATDNNEVWFCAKDVCAILDIDYQSSTLENMPENWVMGWKLPTIKGERAANFINEAGLYHLVFRSKKPKAKEFATWVCEVVLPAIRKHGHFGTVSIKDRLVVMKQIHALTVQLVTCKNAFLQHTTLNQLRELHTLIGSPMPELALISQDIEKTDIFVGGAL